MRTAAIPAVLAIIETSHGQGPGELAFGNAKWTGVMPSVADFVEALSIDHARDGEVMIAYAM